MLGRRRRSHDPCQRLRMAVEAMPVEARRAMLRGLDDNTIIVGAYADSSIGGVCPMLAAHRNGGRVSLASFARSWDRYTDANGRRPRRATGRELRTLRALLVSSLVEDGAFEPVEDGVLEPHPPAAPESTDPDGEREWVDLVVRRHPRRGRTTDRSLIAR